MKKIFLYLILAVCSAAGNAQTMLAHWTFDNGGAADVSGNSLNGIAANVTAVAGKSGLPNTALQFNGTNSTVDVPYNSMMNMSTLSIVAIVKPLGFNSGVCQGNFIIGRGMDWQASTNPYGITMTDNMNDNSCNTYTPGQTNFAANIPGSASSSAVWQHSPYINLNQWYCVAVTIDIDTVKIYVDGILKVVTNYTPTPATSSYPISIGYSLGLLSIGYPYYFNGIIDDIELWNGVLSAQAITAKCIKAPMQCEIEDIVWLGSAKSPLKYTFTAAAKPTSVKMKWNFGDGTMATSTGTQLVNHIYNNTGKYTVCAQAMDGDSICGDSLCFNLYAENGPIIINAPAGCKIDDITWGSSAKNPLKYTFGAVINSSTIKAKWNFGDGTSAIATGNQTVSHTYSNAGKYIVCLQAMNGDTVCGDSLCFELHAASDPTGIKGNNDSLTFIAEPYPNPASTMLYVPVRAKSGEVSISIISVDGKRMLSTTIRSVAGDKKIELSIGDLPIGTYMLEIVEDGARRMEKISKL